MKGRDPAAKAHDLRYQAMTLRNTRNLDGAYDLALDAVATLDDSEGRELRDGIATSISKRLCSISFLNFLSQRRSASKSLPIGSPEFFKNCTASQRPIVSSRSSGLLVNGFLYIRRG